MPRTKVYPTTEGLVHYGTDIYALKTTYGDADSYKTIYCAYDTTMEVHKTLTLDDAVTYFYGAGGYLWCLTQVGSPPTSGKITLIDAATMTVTRTTTIDWSPQNATCDTSALYVPKHGSTGVASTITRYLASDGSTSTYTAAITEITTGSSHAAGGKLWWYVGSKMHCISPATMTLDYEMALIGVPDGILADATFIYAWFATVYQTYRYDIATGADSLAETNYWEPGQPRYYPAAMFMSGGFLYVPTSANVRKVGCADMVNTAWLTLDETMTGDGTTDGTNVWMEYSLLTSTAKFLLADLSYIDSIWLWTGTAESNAVWFQLI